MQASWTPTEIAHARYSDFEVMKYVIEPPGEWEYRANFQGFCLTSFRILNEIGPGLEPDFASQPLGFPMKISGSSYRPCTSFNTVISIGSASLKSFSPLEVAGESSEVTLSSRNELLSFLGAAARYPNPSPSPIS